MDMAGLKARHATGGGAEHGAGLGNGTRSRHGTGHEAGDELDDWYGGPRWGWTWNRG